MKAYRFHTIVALLLAVLILAACGSGPAAGEPEGQSEGGETPAAAPTQAPTPTPPPTQEASGGACLVGEWQVTDFGTYITSVLPEETVGGGPEYLGTSGSLHYTFDAQNQVFVEAQDFNVQFKIAAAGISFDLNVVIDGSGSSTYQPESESAVTFSQGDYEVLNFDVLLNGSSISEDSSLENIFPFDTDTESTFSYHCQGDTLELTPPVEGAQPVILARD